MNPEVDEPKLSIAETIKRSELFLGLDNIDIQKIVDLPSCQVAEYDDQETIFKEGEEAKKYKSIYGGCTVVAEVPSASFMPAGKGVGALPSGRLAGEPLCEASTPTVGSDVKGPTAILRSVGKVNNAEVNQGTTLNMRLDPAVFEKEDGFKRLADLIRVFVDQKVDHVQINVVSSDTLRAAQREPDKYKDLTVKVAGYNARFVELRKDLQDSIIARTEHGL